MFCFTLSKYYLRLLVLIHASDLNTNKNNLFLSLFPVRRWCVFFSHPADFTPVCTTELGRIAVHFPEFAKRNCKLMAHSVDQLNSHVDWVNDIKSYCLDIPGKFPYPIVADPEGKLAIALGIIDPKVQQPGDLTARALYIIR